ncbi:MAG: class I SAM-dependent methyltransferase [Flammeovirgaceae bacterium]|nr:class I SAM-dependent methyltransferase [Flammeovirgaceae bacterium]
MNLDIAKKEWFTEWFDSPFYHLLYQHRNEAEAHKFMRKLTSVVPLQPRSKVLDVACGKGRHAIFLHQRGLDVVGVDLSAENIAFASQFANDRLQFFRHDMRCEYPQKAFFDLALNLFTSFGYFDTDDEHLQALRAIANALKKNGIFVLDFFNTPQVLKSLPNTVEKQIEDVHFFIYKYFHDGFICKDIEVRCLGRIYYYQEKVRAFDEKDFLELFQKVELTPQALYGNYDLAPYEPFSSERMIWMVEKR